jgi:hypothetical protein
MLIIVAATRKQERQAQMRTTGQIQVRYLHSERANFTLRIRRKARPSASYPFGPKKLICLGWRCDFLPGTPRIID